MTANGFATGVANTRGEWPPLPQWWSYSSLVVAEECPRRWSLTRARYPDLWDRPGYPPRPSTPALVGNVVHRVLEEILAALHERGCTSLSDPSAVAVLKDLGGYSALAGRALDEELQRLAGNPRMAAHLEATTTTLRARIPDIRQRAQKIVSRTTLTDSVASTDRPGSGEQHNGLGIGSYPEIELRAPHLRLFGRIDLLTVAPSGAAITDYKTGDVSVHHEDQLTTYALLWKFDPLANPGQLAAQELRLAYPDRDIDVPAPSDADLDALSSQTIARIENAEKLLADRPPAAKPSVEGCRTCPVRHLCSEYWESDKFESTQASEQDGWFDYQGTITSRNGPRSWFVEGGKPHKILVRTRDEDPPFRAGHRVRLLNLMTDPDPDSPIPVGLLTPVAEVFEIEPRSP